jgi:hypothetical protein
MDGDARLAQCGFAKLAGILDGREMVHYVTKYEVVLGRTSKSSSNVDVVLGAPFKVAKPVAYDSQQYQSICF